MINMVSLKYIFIFFLGYICRGVYGLAQCRDCISSNECFARKGFDVQNKGLVASIRESICGFTVDSNRNIIPKVCCSKIQEPILLQELLDPIETHPKLKLLPDSCGGLHGNRLVGGFTANMYEYPWMAILLKQSYDGRVPVCGGSIINSKYILTAAHCVRSTNVDAVRLGEYDTRYDSDCNGEGIAYACEENLPEIEVAGVYEKGVDGRHSNDIALLRLKEDIDFSFKNTKPICLPISKESRSMSLVGVTAEIAGWGTTENNTHSFVLMKARIPIKKDSECRGRKFSNSKFEMNKEICAGNEIADSCKGDSGGPLMVEGSYKGVNRQIQYGIVSRGADICGGPAIYTDVTKHMQWILDTIEK